MSVMLVAIAEKIWVRGLIGAIALSLSSCGFESAVNINISSGAEGSGYQRISEQINDAAESIGNLKVTDNYNSQGSLQNLERLLNQEVDFAIVQLDVASEAMKEGKVKTLVILTQEYLHLVTRKDSEIQSFADLKGKKVAVGSPGSGIYFTAKRIFEASNLNIIEVPTSDKRIDKLLREEIDAFVYVGPLGASENMRKSLRETENLRFIPLDNHIINYLNIQFPESYRSAIIPQGTYKPLPQLPSDDLATIATPGALITRPDVSRKKVALLTWAIASNVRQFAPFYPEFATEEGQKYLNQGLTYVHNGAQFVFMQGDPRNVWLRYLQDNKPLQAASIMLISTSSLGFFMRWWRRRRYKNLIIVNRQAINELRQLMEKDPASALDEVEELRQKYRLMLIDGTVATEAYEEVEKMNKIFADQCRISLEKQHQDSINLVLSSLSEWQETLNNNPYNTIENLQRARQKYLEMLLSKQINLQTYLQLIQVSLGWATLFSVSKPLATKIFEN